MEYAARHAVTTFSPAFADEYLVGLEHGPPISSHILGTHRHAVRVLLEFQRRGTWDTRRRACSPFVSPQTPLEDLIVQAHQATRGTDASIHVSRATRRCWHHVWVYAAQQGVEVFSPAFADDYLAAVQQRSPRPPGLLNDSQHALWILQGFHQHGAWDGRRQVAAPFSAPHTPLEVLIAEAYQALTRRGTGASAVRAACRCWRQVRAYAARHAVEHFSPAFADAYLVAYGERPFRDATKHALRILVEFQQRGTWDRRVRAAPPFPSPRTPLEGLVAQAHQAMVAAGTGDAATRDAVQRWREFLAYATRHAVQTYTPAMADAYWEEYQRQPAVSAGRLRGTKHALRILREFHQRGSWDQYPVRQIVRTPPFATPRTPLETLMAQAYQHMEVKGYSPAMCAEMARRWQRFAVYADAHGAAMVTPDLADTFAATHQEGPPSAHATVARAMSMLLDFQRRGTWRMPLRPAHAASGESPTTPLEALIAEVRQAMTEQGYRAHTLSSEFRFCQQFASYARSRGVDTLSPALVDAYLAHCRADPDVPDSHVTAATRALRRLLEFAADGCWQRVPQRPPTADLVSLAFAMARDRFLRYWDTERHVARNTAQYGRRYTLRFLQFLEDEGVHEWADVSAPLIGRFICEQPTWSPAARHVAASTVRLFLRYLFVHGDTDRDWSVHLPCIQRGPTRKLPVIWTPEELAALLGAVERASAVGKRDYAILLLAARLGLRTSDIRQLRLDDIDWAHARLTFVQEKTGAQTVLPLPAEVGEALIAYLREARPQSAHREVFLGHTAPFAPLSENNRLHPMVNRYRARAGLHWKAGQAHGLHSLRHTFASQLLEATVPLETIASLLGHRSLESTRIYTHVDLAALRQVALDPEEVSYDR
jgi:site-specific recombinase XerD